VASAVRREGARRGYSWSRRGVQSWLSS
jgi:hypothetical protein